MNKTIDFKKTERLEFLLICPTCDNESGYYSLQEILSYGKNDECPNCGRFYPVRMENIQYHIKE